jgi:hypothetical protein
MVKTLLLGFTLLLSAAWMLAQDTSMPASSGQGKSSSSGSTTVEGCLGGSSGSYTLTDKSGTTYQLSGDTSKLADHVGHQVQITGTTSGSAGSSAAAGAGAPTSGAGAGGQMLTVEKMKHVSKTCKEGAAKQ